jgi:alpha-tubulin suppressor-like RCC1 family protein
MHNAQRQKFLAIPSWQQYLQDLAAGGRKCRYVCQHKFKEYVLDVLLLLQVVIVAVGCGCCYALTDDGDVYAWGAGSKGQLGRGMHLHSSRS